jgi:hypothetical protein
MVKLTTRFIGFKVQRSMFKVSDFARKFDGENVER